MIPTSHFHPMLVHFPIALVLIGFMFDFLSLFLKKELCLTKAGFYLLLFGSITAIFAWLSGTLFTSEMTGSAGEVKETHELFATITVWLLIITSVLRIFANKKPENKGLKWAAFIFYGLAAASVGLTGSFGGTLVYNYMMPL